MKIKVKREFRYMADARTEGRIEPGVYSVPGEISHELAEKILRFGKAEKVLEKVAPENKVVEVSETKVAKKRRRRSRPKSDT